VCPSFEGVPAPHHRLGDAQSRELQDLASDVRAEAARLLAGTERPEQIAAALRAVASALEDFARRGRVVH
jgi:hypothetical protein